MSNEIINNRYNLTDAIVRQTEKINSVTGKTAEAAAQTYQGRSFQEILKEQISQGVSFSKHANLRTEERNIKISESDLSRLGDACDKAQQKGIKDALIVMNDSAFIVNAPNKVVITVVDKNEMKNNLFTNIDGALFL
ncbi:TIGR02530 family flagellar biosynthesis protein [Sinanaerobacter chloroacetimidivorans]|jgi:flagellar operon protein|uniref:Flagellar biosynthesis protein n=1 Tax=Sinanaerobacter chloroacetimidivorans TaxID=2818044 RepID=A0A8J8B2S2_9FIRM|nr:TIGR02530 family flagellar biosynthesis protein [Sinanaerobacter chloroacetimidivorans]MBR0597535.1 flagellar biosynthesis protein [Sinanaerobacter chloroacetimidivorans]